MIQSASRVLVLGVLVFGLLGAGVLSVDDASRDERPPYDRVGDGVVAEPHDGPNGAYAYLDGDGDLVIDLTVDNDASEGDGVSAGAVTGVGDVFTLTNAGEERTRVWLEHDADPVTFRTDSGSVPIEGTDNAVVLEPDESIRIGFTVDARTLESGDAVIESLRIRTNALEDGDESDWDRDPDSVGALRIGDRDTLERTTVRVADTAGTTLEMAAK